MIVSSNSSNKRENIEQIPKEEKIGEVKKVVSEQGGVEGQRKEVNVGDYVKAAAVGQLLKDLQFPADKNKIIQFVQLQQTQQISQKKRKKTYYIYYRKISKKENSTRTFLRLRELQG
jgi:hypothetical protein